MKTGKCVEKSQFANLFWDTITMTACLAKGYNNDKYVQMQMNQYAAGDFGQAEIMGSNMAASDLLHI